MHKKTHFACIILDAYVPAFGQSEHTDDKGEVAGT